ncbi:MAG: DUF975 family protein [Hornefia sp.]|nr:DUF975 family protein [Hornefia sp.]
MESYVLNVDCGSIRKMAREKLSGNWLAVYVGVALAYILAVGMVVFLSNCIPIGQIESQVKPYGPEMFLRTFNQEAAEYRVSVIAYFYQAFISEIFMIGLASFLLKFIRKNDINPGHIFDGFEYYFKAVGLVIVQSIFIFGWALLFIIPGVIKAYSYSQSYYILAENPNKGIIQCITESRRMMDGNKGKLFLLQLTFIGWFILAAIPYGIIYFAVKPVPGSISEFIVFFIGMLPIFIVYEYMQTTAAIFYNLVSGFTKIPDMNAGRVFSESEYHFDDDSKAEDNHGFILPSDESQKSQPNASKEHDEDNGFSGEAQEAPNEHERAEEVKNSNELDVTESKEKNTDNE